MKIGDQKVQRTLRKQKVRGLLQDKKVRGLLQDSWERARLTAPSPAKQGLIKTVRDLVA